MTITPATDSIGKKLCKILGLDSSKTRNITITFAPNDVVLVNAEQYLQEKESEKLLGLLKTITFVGKDEKNKK